MPAEAKHNSVGYYYRQLRKTLRASANTQGHDSSKAVSGHEYNETSHQPRPVYPIKSEIKYVIIQVPALELQHIGNTSWATQQDGMLWPPTDGTTSWAPPQAGMLLPQRMDDLMDGIASRLAPPPQPDLCAYQQDGVIWMPPCMHHSSLDSQAIPPPTVPRPTLEQTTGLDSSAADASDDEDDDGNDPDESDDDLANALVQVRQLNAKLQGLTTKASTATAPTKEVISSVSTAVIVADNDIDDAIEQRAAASSIAPHIDSQGDNSVDSIDLDTDSDDSEDSIDSIDPDSDDGIEQRTAASCNASHIDSQGEDNLNTDSDDSDDSIEQRLALASRNAAHIDSKGGSIDSDDEHGIEILAAIETVAHMELVNGYLEKRNDAKLSSDIAFLIGYMESSAREAARLQAQLDFKLSSAREAARLQATLPMRRYAFRAPYRYTQHPFVLEVVVDLPEDRQAGQLKCFIGNDRLQVGVEDQTPIIDAKLYAQVNVDKSAWALINGKRIEIQLYKKEFGTWPHLFKAQKPLLSEP